MTCIVGIEHDGHVFIGGDSAGVAGLSLSVRADEKVFVNGDVVMGFTSSFRMGQLLRYAFRPPVPQLNEDQFHYMVTSFVDAVRECLKAGGYARKREEAEEAGIFLVGVQGHLYYVGDDYQIAHNVDGYDAVGSGADVARGALFATVGQDPQQRIVTALEAAERNNAGVRRPFKVVML